MAGSLSMGSETYLTSEMRASQKAETTKPASTSMVSEAVRNILPMTKRASDGGQTKGERHGLNSKPGEREQHGEGRAKASSRRHSKNRRRYQRVLEDALVCRAGASQGSTHQQRRRDAWETNPQQHNLHRVGPGLRNMDQLRHKDGEDLARRDWNMSRAERSKRKEPRPGCQAPATGGTAASVCCSSSHAISSANAAISRLRAGGHSKPMLSPISFRYRFLICMLFDSIMFSPIMTPSFLSSRSPLCCDTDAPIN